MKKLEQIKKLLQEVNLTIEDFALYSYHMKREIYEAERKLVISKLNYQVGDIVKHQWKRVIHAKVDSFGDLTEHGDIWVKVRYANNTGIGGEFSKKTRNEMSHHIEKVEDK